MTFAYPPCSLCPASLPRDDDDVERAKMVRRGQLSRLLFSPQTTGDAALDAQMGDFMAAWQNEAASLAEYEGLEGYGGMPEDMEVSRCGASTPVSPRLLVPL